jgi:hypothetical protein
LRSGKGFRELRVDSQDVIRAGCWNLREPL